jgi:hypothetical protein
MVQSFPHLQRHRKKGVTYSRPTTGTGMPSTERFRARPMWACLEPCPLSEISRFVVDSSRSRKSVFQLFKLHTSFSGHPRIESTGQVIMQAAIFARFLSRPNGICSPPRHQNAFPLSPSKSVLVSRPQAGLFSILHTRALFYPRAPFRIANRPASDMAAHSRHPIPLTRNLRIAQSRGGANDGGGADAPYFNQVRNGGLILARNAPSIVQPVCACQCIARPCSLCAPH